MTVFNELIPEHLEDKTTILYKKNKKHTIYTYIFCIILRIIIGILIYYKISIFKYLTFIIPLLLSFVIFTGHKFLLTENNTWKVYLRTLLVSLTAIIISLLNKNENNNIAGILIIVDSLLGLQSRHSTSILYKHGESIV